MPLMPNDRVKVIAEGDHKDKTGTVAAWAPFSASKQEFSYFVRFDTPDKLGREKWIFYKSELERTE